MVLFDWISKLNDFIRLNDVTPNLLLVFFAVTVLAFIFSLREFTSWLTKTSGLRQEIIAIRESQKLLEQKIDILMTLRMKDVDSETTGKPSYSFAFKEGSDLPIVSPTSNPAEHILN